jgi:hypothetical protein
MCPAEYANPVSSIFTEQLTALTSAVLAFFAIGTIIFAAFTWSTQSSQLADQLKERTREAEERRRAQAVQVYLWQTPPTVRHAVGMAAETSRTATLVNSSQQPVHDVKILWMASGVSWGGIRIREAPLMPGEEESATTPLPDDDSDNLVAVAFFRDRAGVTWRTHADGTLDPHVPDNAQLPGGHLPLSALVTPAGDLT